MRSHLWQVLGLLLYFLQFAYFVQLVQAAEPEDALQWNAFFLQFQHLIFEPEKNYNDRQL